MPQDSDVKYETLAIRAPLDFAGFFVREQLKKNGIAFKGQVKVGMTPPDAIRITHHYSAPLSEMSIDFMKMSNNHATETLLKTLGAQSVKGQGTFANGLEAVKRFLAQEVRIDPAAFMSADGSGLSRDNRVSAKLLTDLLSYMWKNFQAGPEFISSLALYGEDGTLRRQNDPLFIKRVRAKTGSMRDIKSLAGYLQLESGKVIGFAVLTNGAPGQTAQKKAIDAILLALGRLN
jgi:D-alanyl-D-alanine carboxypeptidase/D-alanyl-D-alanine-endopeptidase (penicillin-binding protein 4)